MDTSVAFDREAADAEVLSPAEEEALLEGAPWRRFVVLGDSIAEGMGDHSPGYAPRYWGDRVAGALRRKQPDLAYVNLGKRDLRARQVRTTQLTAAVTFKPDLAAVVCGGNDLLTQHFDGAAVEGELEAIVARLAGAGAEVITFTMLDMPRALSLPPPIPERLDELHERTRELSARLDTLLVDLAREPICAEPELYSADLKHGSTRGHAVVASHVIRRLGARLGNAVERRDGSRG